MVSTAHGGDGSTASRAGPGLAGNTNWVQFADETDTRLVADPAVGADDVQEKDYAWGDVDQDGDIDLVVVRKQIGSTAGRRPNVLFMNEWIAEGHAINGVLVDRTEQYASDADDGGLGFLDETNDRDVALVDVNGDGWLDIVTAVAHGQGLPKTISHPRVYINKANDEMGDWLGFRYEEARIPPIRRSQYRQADCAELRRGRIRGCDR
ncbi:MAG: VCBS repeat-containing protein [Planctomycetes bacterium]|nr:VCBS repeat-containing protein [Planctomycetota bacterium]